MSRRRIQVLHDATHRGVQGDLSQANTVLINILGKELQVEDNEEFWLSASRGEWEPETFRILQAFLDTRSAYIDVGAWIGPTSLFAASYAERVVAFEPDPTAYSHLARNLELNPNLAAKVQVVRAALSTENSTLPLYSRWEFGDSGSSLLSRIKARGTAIEVTTQTLQDTLAQCGVERVDFIKMDIEGGEFDVIPAIVPFLKQQLPVLYLSFHLDALSEALVSVETSNRLAVKASNMVGRLGWNPALEKARSAALARLRGLTELLGFYDFIYTASGTRLSREVLEADIVAYGNEALLFSCRPWP